MASSSLPPRVSEIADGSISWEKIEGVDFELLGYFLSCHLVIEHYLEQYLKVSYAQLDWDAAKQTFGQKAALLSTLKVSDRYDCIPAIKHLNALRNKLSHRVAFKITSEELLPLSQYLKKAYDNASEVPSSPREILEQFTTMTCVLFAGMLTGHLEVQKARKKK